MLMLSSMPPLLGTMKDSKSQLFTNFMISLKEELMLSIKEFNFILAKPSQGARQQMVTAVAYAKFPGKHMPPNPPTIVFVT